MCYVNTNTTGVYMQHTTISIQSSHDEHNPWPADCQCVDTSRHGDSCRGSTCTEPGHKPLWLGVQVNKYSLALHCVWTGHHKHMQCLHPVFACSTGGEREPSTAGYVWGANRCIYGERFHFLPTCIIVSVPVCLFVCLSVLMGYGGTGADKVFAKKKALEKDSSSAFLNLQERWQDSNIYCSNIFNDNNYCRYHYFIILPCFSFI